MPVVSKKQFKFMKAAEAGDIKVPGLSKKEAKEMTKDSKYSKLVNMVRKNKRG